MANSQYYPQFIPEHNLQLQSLFLNTETATTSINSPSPSINMMLEPPNNSSFGARTTSTVNLSLGMETEKRNMFVIRLAVVLDRLRTWEEKQQQQQQQDSNPTTATTRKITGQQRQHILTDRVKRIVQYSTQRNRMGDPRYTPLVDSIENSLKLLLGLQEWFSVCMEAKQRRRVHTISHLLISSCSNQQPQEQHLKRLPKITARSEFQTTFFP